MKPFFRKANPPATVYRELNPVIFPLCKTIRYNQGSDNTNL